MEERPASSQFIRKRLDTYSLTRVLIVFSTDTQGDSEPGRHNDTGRPYLDIELIDSSGDKEFFHIVRVIGAVFGAHRRIQFTMGCPEPSLGNGCVWVESALKNDLLEVRGENPENEKEVGIRCGRRDK